MELPFISEDRIPKSSDFLSFAINHKQRGEDWKAFGKKFANYILSFVMESNFDPTDKEQLKQKLDSILTPTVMLFSADLFLRHDKLNLWEAFLLQQAEKQDNSNRVDKSAVDWFGEGLTEAFTDKWPLVMELL